ncbi:hypothetical protein [Mycetocola reblochoni]|uniref:Uncharacterized protein n=2 Tax=Mycetocola reblochoni TaxID=331618 RepID=A0A1R4KBF0_9MICO|nr:hypothetical protein [Mycetocola reblochoni]RLP69226.1 hypothetical protein D9V30_07890 [Mycetocola reblochoni]SJN41472.1 hypothetical protein FM119_12645 [Mycetocola reblochoni REB411]
MPLDPTAPHPTGLPLAARARAGTPVPPRPTSRLAWTILVLCGTGLAIARVPSSAEYARTLVTPEQRAALGDRALEDTAILIGAIGAVPVFTILLLILAFVAGVLESRLFPHGVSRGRIRVGVGWLTVAVGAVGVGLVSLVSGAPPRGDGALRPLVLLGVALAAPALVRDGRTVRGYGRALLVTVPLGLLLCIQ